MSNKTLHQLYEEHTGKVSDKWSLYLSEYDRLLDGYRDKPVRMLEIGIQNGGSLDIWLKYFSNAAALIGCDINPECGRLQYDDPRIFVTIGDANAVEVQKRVLQLAPQFDIVIDDGSHVSGDIIKSFTRYFPHLAEGGLYIAEDLHCSYWREFQGGLFDPYSAISFFKSLVDVINHEHWGAPKARADILQGVFAKYDCEINEELLAQVHSVEFINSMCVVRKAACSRNRLQQRVVVGHIEPVFAGLIDQMHKPDPVPDQSDNSWTTRHSPPAEAIQKVEVQLADSRRQILGLGRSLAERNRQVSNLDQTIGARDGQIASLSQALGDRDEQIANFRNSDSALTARNASLTAENSALRSSLSWRITAPLRLVAGLIIAVVRIGKLTRHSVRLGGGYWATAALMVEVLRKEGAEGVKWRLNNSRALMGNKNLFSRSPNESPSVVDSNTAHAPLLQAAPLAKKPVKLICFYLPQFHAIPENDAWWGQGFTEWTNVKSGQPQFVGHYQPHMPAELGYYDLLDPSVQRRQVELAKSYGVGGFCFYFYWFNGKRLLEAPLLNYLSDSSLTLPFCLCWANENWSRRWDGLDGDILIAQQHSTEDDLAFIRHVSRYMNDPRYIRVSGKPLLLVYRPNLLPSAKETVSRWRNWCRLSGIGEIYLAYTQSFETVDPSLYGFDAAVEFPPNNSAPPKITANVSPKGKDFGSTVYDWRAFVERSENYETPNYTLFRSVCPAWDNTARRNNRSTIFLNSTPALFQHWLENAIRDTNLHRTNPDENLIFVNAWNEWSEGAHLEPDQRYGYAYLEAARRALNTVSSSGGNSKIIVVSHDAHPHGAQFLALGIVRSLKQDFHFEVAVVLLGAGRLAKNFADFAEIHDCSGVDSALGKMRTVSRSLAERGFTLAIVNSTASGRIIPVFQEAEIECISLVHELPGIIEEHMLHEQAKMIATFAKKVVFPVQMVADEFQQFAAVEGHKQVVRAQGLYRKNKWRFRKEEAKAKICQRLGLSTDTKIVLTVGFADFRKGVDIFVECACQILARRDRVAFIWVGHWDPELYQGIEKKLLGNRCKDRIHFVGYDPDTAPYHAASNVYALTSREEPFGNVVLESFDVAVPVVAFAAVGGGARLVEDIGGGITVPQFDAAAFSAAICSLLDDAEMSNRFGSAAQSHVDEYFAFRSYVFDLCAMLNFRFPRISVIVPNFNYAQYIEERLASICRQTIPIYELIILDDASTDQSSIKISDWLASTQIHARVVINSNNSGNVFSQWRKGISLATGDYIWIAEADDLSEPDFLETVIPAFESGKVVLSYCESQQIDSRGIVIEGNYQDYVSVVSRERWQHAFVADGIEEIKSSLAIMNIIPNVSAVVFRRAVINTVFDNHFDEIRKFKKAGDWVVYFRALAHGNIAYSPKAANCHRRHEDSVIGATEKQGLVQEISEVQQLVAHTYQLAETVRSAASNYLTSLQKQFDICDQPDLAHTSSHPIYNDILVNEGHCPTCDQEVIFIASETWLRDEYLCAACGSTPRERALMHVIEQYYPDWRELVIHETSPGNRGASVRLAQYCKKYIPSQFFAGQRPGVIYHGMRCENLEALTFDDDSIDLHVSQDVMEHVFNPALAFKEIARTLKPGGAHIFTVPLVNKLNPSRVRARVNIEGTIEHIEEPVYHGNPIDASGSLVIMDWGYDIAKFIFDASGLFTSILYIDDIGKGIRAEYIEVCVTLKPANPQACTEGRP